MPSTFLISAISAILPLTLGAGHYDSQHTLFTGPNLSSCSLQPSVFSCENTTTIKDTCCSPTPGGLVLQTQLWNTWTGYEGKGQKLPQRSWTIHGLWPDNCDGSYEQYCDFSRQYDPNPFPAVLPNGTKVPPYDGPEIDTFIEKFGRYDLLDTMKAYWISQGSPNTAFWAHEFSKHGTCTSTFNVACYGPGYIKHQDVVDFFDATVRAFRHYPTFDMLASYGILPSNKTSYTLAQFQSAILSQIGVIPYFGCVSNGTILSEVWYFNHVYGTEQYGTYKPINTTTTSSCSETKPIWYFERAIGSERR
ncbi:hypothetical protein AX15_001561 [Amanita polypyramis BW_CC]|nr:hypothetical protein AX15_001561 [Amanita polypyramis BW_CC]